MNVFLSWSGDRSRLVAEALKPWIKCVLQTTSPWISTTDIDRGSLWMSEIGNKLQDSNIGIICLTAENQSKPWILFEAGALAKGIETNRVCTLLIDLQPSDIRGPLSQFNHTTLDKESMLKLVFMINTKLPNPIDNDILNKTFLAFWPELEQRRQDILQMTENSPPVAPVSDGDLLRDIANNISVLVKRVSKVEEQIRTTNDISFRNHTGGGLLGFTPATAQSSSDEITMKSLFGEFDQTNSDELEKARAKLQELQKMYASSSLKKIII